MRDLFSSLRKTRRPATTWCPPQLNRPEFGVDPGGATADDRIIHHGRGGAKYAPWTGGERIANFRRFCVMRQHSSRSFTTDSGVGDNLTEGGKTNLLIWDGRGRRMEDQSITAAKKNPYSTGVIQLGSKQQVMQQWSPQLGRFVMFQHNFEQ